MSTEYVLARGKNRELLLDEHSNLFDLTLNRTDAECEHVIMRDMTTEDVQQLALRMLQVCGYWGVDTTADDLKHINVDYVELRT